MRITSLRRDSCKRSGRVTEDGCTSQRTQLPAREGEEYAQFKAFHCSLIRCPGVGMCADPLMCAPTMFPNNRGVYKYRPAWRARTTPPSGRCSSRHGCCRAPSPLTPMLCQKKTLSTPKASRRMLQIHFQPWIRSVIRYYRENAPAESPSNYGYGERITHPIISCLGCPLWHDDQLHLSEWQASQQIEYIPHHAYG